LNNGALYAIIDNEAYFIDERTILVSDSLVALQGVSQLIILLKLQL
jgi:UDP-N-acetylmuramoyl-tripeptide--D-alanyl-D-alanine ligase